ncbi:MAG: glutamine amidotransferase [Beutenbergiaceae bacterium]
MKPFLLLATRPEDDAADGEYASFLQFTGLAPQKLRRFRLEQAPLPPIDLDDYSGIFLGGSPFNSGETHKSELQRRVEGDLNRLLADVVARDFPFFGACYGVGTLGLLAGGVLDTTYSEPVSAVEVEVTPQGAQDPLLAGMPPRFAAYVGHKEALSQLPPGAVLLATAQSCPIQMFRLGRNMYATQFHPELDEAAIVTRIYTYANHGYFPPETRDEVITAVRGAPVGSAHQLLSAFAQRYARE